MNEEKILLEWLLASEEIDFIIEKSRGIENRLKYAVQICHLRIKGRFVENWEEITISILNHLTKQLETELVHNKLTAQHNSTDARVRGEIKKFLGFKELDFKTDTKVADFLAQNPVLISNKSEITKEIEKFLIKGKVMLPSKSQLMRFVYSKYGKTQIDVFEVFASKITEEQKKYLDDIYEKDILLSNVKKPIGEVNIKNVTPKIETIEKLIKLKLEDLPWKLIHPS